MQVKDKNNQKGNNCTIFIYSDQIDVILGSRAACRPIVVMENSTGVQARDEFSILCSNKINDDIDAAADCEQTDNSTGTAHSSTNNT